MKRTLTLFILTFLAGSFCATAQTSTLIISENFQDWEGTEDTDPTDCESGLVHETENIRQMELTLDGATVDIDVTLIKCGISPDCDTKRFERDGTPSTEGVTVGYVSLSKTVEETDTIGQFIFGPIHHIDSIRFGHSATGDNRGIRIYKSSDGETWERASEDEFYSADDSQAGEVNTVVLGDTNVYIRFTSGIKQSDGSSQHSRLHNLEVWGIPGAAPSAIGSAEIPKLNIYNLGSGIYAIEGDIVSLSVYSVSGAQMYSDTMHDVSTVDLSFLPTGIYFLRATDRTGQYFVRKLLRN